MPRLSNPKHEAFARYVAKGASASEAYRRAGYEDDTANASRLTANDSVKARIAEHQDRIARKAHVDAAMVLTKLREVMLDKTADKRDQLKAAELIAKTLGMFEFTKRSEVKVTQVKEALSGMPDSDFAAIRDIMQKAREQKRSD